MGYVRPLLFTKLRDSLNRIEFTIWLSKGAGICSLNRGISLNWDSLNRDLSVFMVESKSHTLPSILSTI